MPEPLRIGLDFGGVIIRSSTISRGERTLFDEPGDLLSHTHPGMLEAVAELVERSAGQIWIVSKARAAMQPVIERFLAEVSFFERTGFPRDQVEFCLERSEKRQICLERAISHFVDDRMALMKILRGAVPHLFLFSPPDAPIEIPADVTGVSSWSELLSLLRE